MLPLQERFLRCVRAALDKEAKLCRAVHFNCTVTALYALVIPASHWGKSRPGAMFSDLICAEVIAARMPGLMTCYSRAWEGVRQESPPRWPSHGVRLPRIWATRLASRIKRSWGLYIQHGYICVWQRSCLPLRPRSHCALIMGEVTWGILWSVWKVVSMCTETMWLQERVLKKKPKDIMYFFQTECLFMPRYVPESTWGWTVAITAVK